MIGIEDAFKVELPVEMLFNKRTVMALARTIDTLPTVHFDELNNGRERIEL